MMSVLLLGLLACGTPPTIQGKVVDIWGNPVEGATVMMVGQSARQMTDAEGRYQLPVVAGEHELPPFSAERVKAMMDEYYEERGWDLTSGAPTSKKLEELGLEDIDPDVPGENNEL